MEDIKNEINNKITFNKSYESEKNSKNQNDLIEKSDDIAKYYFVSAFHKNFSEKKFNFTEKDISIIYQKPYKINPDYLTIIYCYRFNKKQSKLPKKFNFEMSFDNDKRKFKIEINIKSEKIRFIFDIIEIKNIPLLIELLDKEHKIPSLTTKNYYNPLNFDEIFSIYFEYLNSLNQDKNNLKIELKEFISNLIDNYITTIKFKKNLSQQRNFNTIIKLFILCYENEKIILFLDTFKSIKIKLEIDKMEQIDDKFIRILNDYEKDKNKLSIPLKEELENQKKKNKFKKYSK